MRIARTKDDGEQVLFAFVVELKSSDHGKKTKLKKLSCCAAGGIVSRVQVDRDASGLSAQSFGVALDHDISDFFSHAEEFFRRGAIFKARKSGLGTEVLAFDRITIQQEFLHRIGGQRVRVIAVGISGCNSVYTLPK